jgi:hypothetical protein
VVQTLVIATHQSRWRKANRDPKVICHVPTRKIDGTRKSRFELAHSDPDHQLPNHSMRIDWQLTTNRIQRVRASIAVTATVAATRLKLPDHAHLKMTFGLNSRHNAVCVLPPRTEASAISPWPCRTNWTTHPQVPKKVWNAESKSPKVLKRLEQSIQHTHSTRETPLCSSKSLENSAALAHKQPETLSETTQNLAIALYRVLC